MTTFKERQDELNDLFAQEEYARHCTGDCLLGCSHCHADDLELMRIELEHVENERRIALGELKEGLTTLQAIISDMQAAFKKLEVK